MTRGKLFVLLNNRKTEELEHHDAQVVHCLRRNSQTPRALLQQA